MQADGLGREWEVLRGKLMRIKGCVCQTGRRLSTSWVVFEQSFARGLEPKALTTHYTADKAICEESFLKAIATFLLHDCWHCRFAFLSNTVELRVRVLTCMLRAIL